MSLYDKLINGAKFVDRVVAFCSKKSVKTFIVALTVCTLFWGQIKTFAVESTEIWEQATEVVASDTKTTVPHIGNTAANWIIGILLSVAEMIMPEILTNIQSDANIDPSYKTGLLTVSSVGIEQLYANFPTFSVPQHLAQQWVPGYSDETSVYAQGLTDGYNYLVGMKIDKLWGTFVVIAYVLFVLVLVVAGFMIMFRQKIGGQVAITVYNTIPDVIMGLVLITFSFAIVGLILNLSVFLTKIGAGILGISSIKDAVVVEHPFSLVFGTNLVGPFKTAINNWQGGDKASAIITFLVAGILYLAYLSLSVKVFIVLLKSLLSLLVDTIFAPILIVISTIPGNKAMRQAWFNRVLKNALIFPIIFVIINVPIYLDKIGISVNLYGLTTADLTSTGGSAFVISVIKIFIPLLCYNFAVNVPTMLNDFLPSGTGQNMQKAMEGTLAGFKKTPLIGALLG